MSKMIQIRPDETIHAARLVDRDVAHVIAQCPDPADVTAVQLR